MNLSIRELNELIYSLGITAHHGMLVNKELNESLLEKLYGELNSKLSEEDDNTNDTLLEATLLEALKQFNKTPMTFVSNEVADGGLKDSLPNFKHTPPAPKKLGEGTAQSILDYVEENGPLTHKEIYEYYKSLNGSNTFAYCLRNLIIPYKNRITQRYLAKTTNGKYVVRIANIHNWVEKYY